MPSAQAMIKMSYDQMPAVRGRQALEHVQQDHRVQSAGDGEDHRLARSQKTMAANIRLHAPQQVVHVFQVNEVRIKLPSHPVGGHGVGLTAALPY